MMNLSQILGFENLEVPGLSSKGVLVRSGDYCSKHISGMMQKRNLKQKVSSSNTNNESKGNLVKGKN